MEKPLELPGSPIDVVHQIAQAMGDAVAEGGTAPLTATIAFTND